MQTVNFKRLFADSEIDEHGIRRIREEKLEDGGTITWLETPRGIVLVHDYADPADGFELYTNTPNRISETRVAIGLPPERPEVDDERPFGVAKGVTFKGAGK